MENIYIAETIDGRVRHNLVHVVGEEREEALKAFARLEADDKERAQKLAKGERIKMNNSRSLTNEEFHKRLKVAARGRYEFDHLVFTRVKDKYKPICPKHGEWEVVGNSLLDGSGCMKCYKESLR